MSPSSVIWSSQQLTSLRTFTEHNNYAVRHGMGRVAFRNGQPQAGQKCRSHSQRQSQAPLSDAVAMQRSRRDTILAAVLALQLPAVLPWDAAHALG